MPLQVVELRQPASLRASDQCFGTDRWPKRGSIGFRCVGRSLSLRMQRASLSLTIAEERASVLRSVEAQLEQHESRPQIRRDYPLNLSISVSGGKETNRDSHSNCE